MADDDDFEQFDDVDDVEIDDDIQGMRFFTNSLIRL